MSSRRQPNRQRRPLQATPIPPEQHFQEQFTREIEDVYTGDPAPLFEGSIQLKDAVNRNIDRYLQTNTYINLGLKTIVTITSLNGKLLYPDVFSQGEITAERPDSQQVAAENFALMNEGLTLKVETKFEHNRLLSNLILTLYVLLSIAILYTHYRTAAKKVKIENQRNRREIDRLQKMEHEGKTSDQAERTRIEELLWKVVEKTAMG